ncbi:MAG: hypothetical protein IKF38_01715 [Clostridia bacterium]|nr:hypothetical protein [Clostridia bacterium]
MPENTGSLTDMGVKSGDYVNYTAGNWTQEDIDKLGNLYSGEAIPDSTNPYTFGGFKVGQSKDVGIIKGENNASVQDNEHAGWRVLKINDDRSVDIIHAGCPEWYYHPTYYKRVISGNQYKSAYRSLYILGGGKSDQVTEDSYEGVFERNWKMYENQEFCVNVFSHLVTMEDMKSNGATYQGPASVWFRHGPSFFWVRCEYASTGGIFKVNPSTGSMNGYGRDESCGIRPVVTLKAECLYQNINNGNTTTHDTQETAWNLVI